MVVDVQDVSRERTPRRARVELEELTMRRRIKKDLVVFKRYFINV